jgi:7,8-dihydropterin-6-yl-methyl-4-(beta-D-ribofuranosyl)aminobenzene 5'-phosphate synthase
MQWRISPLLWPILAITGPLWVPFLLIRYQGFKKDRTRAVEQNRLRIDAARALDIPTVEEIELTVLSEWRARDGFRGEPGVSYHFRTNLGSVLYDVAFGDESGVVAHNANRLGITAEDVDAVVISHLHDDHTGGARAFRSRELGYPAALRRSELVPCFLPAEFRADGFEVEVVSQPRLLTEGSASTGPLARRLFFLGWVEEQAVVIRLQGKGVVVFSGCGHPTLPVILEMVTRMTSDPIYAIGGGLHLPLTQGRVGSLGIDLQTILGTGKPPWKRTTQEDIDVIARTIRDANPQRVFLSAHDSCDEALSRLAGAVDCDVDVLEAGGVYRL